MWQSRGSSYFQFSQMKLGRFDLYIAGHHTTLLPAQCSQYQFYKIKFNSIRFNNDKNTEFSKVLANKPFSSMCADGVSPLLPTARIMMLALFGTVRWKRHASLVSDPHGIHRSPINCMYQSFRRRDPMTDQGLM